MYSLDHVESTPSGRSGEKKIGRPILHDAVALGGDWPGEIQKLECLGCNRLNSDEVVLWQTSLYNTRSFLFRFHATSSCKKLYPRYKETRWETNNVMSLLIFIE